MPNRFLRKTKILIAVLAIVTLLTPSFAVKAQTVRVVGGWLDNIWHIPQLNPIIAATTAETKQTLFEWFQTFVLETLKKRILDLVVDEIVQWVKGEGDPKFITDWQQFLTHAGDVALGELAVRVAGAGICEPFKDGILKNLQIPERGPFSNGSLYGSSITCTLDEIVDNIEGFYEDFSTGGWEAYTASWQVQNNPISVYILTESDRAQTIASAQAAAQLEGLAGGGFLSTKSCEERVRRPGEANTSALGPDIDGDKQFGDIRSTCEITTPGSTIGDLLSKAVGADIERIIEAEQLSTYIAEIANALFNRLIREGVSGLAGLSTDNAPDGGSIPEGVNGCDAFASSSPMRGACDAYIGSNSEYFQTTRDTLTADMEAAKAGLSELRPVLVDWKNTADALSAYVTTQSENKAASCISNALEPHFTPPTVQQITALSTAIDLQIKAVDAQLTLIASYNDQLLKLNPNDWTAFVRLASAIETVLPNRTDLENDLARALVEKRILDDASVEIIRDISRCF